MENGGTAGAGNPARDVDPVATKETRDEDIRRYDEWRRGQSEERLSPRAVDALVRRSLTDHLAMRRLADSPEAMADEVLEMRKTQDYMIWALALLGFLVWVALVTRGPNRY